MLCCDVTPWPPTHPLHKFWRWVAWEAHPAWGLSRRVAGARALLPASVISCLMQKILCWNSCWRQSWAFWRSCCLILEKHITGVVFLWNFIIEDGVHMHTHYHKWLQKITDILSEKYRGFFFWVSHFLRFSCFVAQRRWHLPISSYWQSPVPPHLLSPSPHQHVSRISFFHCLLIPELQNLCLCSLKQEPKTVFTTQHYEVFLSYVMGKEKLKQDWQRQHTSKRQ